MADGQLRPEVVAALSEPAHLPAAVVDQLLDATDEERAAAAGELLDQTRSFLEEAGALRPSRSILDLNHDEMQVLASVYAVVWRWWASPGYRERPLSAILKVAPTEVAEAAMRLLRVIGFVPPEPQE